MAPKPQEHKIASDAAMAKMNQERIVISGMSGLYPLSQNVKDLANTLYDQIDPITHNVELWDFEHPEVPKYFGAVDGLDKFDASFFKVHRRLGLCMDPVSRKMLEYTYQAIYDAGFSPAQLSGKNIGVFTGVSLSDSEKSFYYNRNYVNSSTIVGFSRAMYSNRISYWLDVKGPSITVDTVCCSSLTAFELAYLAIQRGDCEAAIVAAGSSNIHPQILISYGRNLPLCKDGKTKSFDQDAQGCVKSEAISVMFLQKAKDALRVYADVVHIKTSFSPIQNDVDVCNKYTIYRTPEQFVDFLTDFYKDINVPPHQIKYVEAFGTATPDVDKAELEAFDYIYCKDRTDPLLVGSIMSNIGYSEAPSGLASMTKVLLAYHQGEIAPNLHYSKPRTDIAAIKDGRINIVTNKQPLARTYAAINNFSITGANAHVLLKGYYKAKDPACYKSVIPRLVTISGRQETAVQKIIDDLKSRPVDPEELALLHHIHEVKTNGHLARGYLILDTDDNNETLNMAEQVAFFDDIKRPVWFVYSGMGSQWVGMGAQLLCIPIFAAAIERCKRVLDPKGVDIVNIISSNDKSTFDNILHSFVGIAAIQIGLTDILRELGIVPDNIIGHSVGELGCGYADGCLTAEEMILAAYSRGLVSVQTPFIKGSMAAVGVGYQKIVKLCPPEIEVACHNSPESCTISGPVDSMKDFVSTMTAQGIFAKEVPCSNIAYHSRYISSAGPKLLEYLKEVIKNPKPRSERWLSTSVPQERWGETNAQFCSAWYHTNNLLSPVLFEETSRLVPDNAVVIEVAPHGLLQAILKRSFPPDCRHVPLTKRDHSDNVVFLLEAIGKLYMHGCYPKIQVLYPKIEFPVSTGTPLLSHLVEWSHTDTWDLLLFLSNSRKSSALCKFVISIHDDEHCYLQGHIMQGKNTYPYAAALVAVWDTLSMANELPKKQTSVQFRDIHLYGQPPLHHQKHLKLNVELHRGTGRFEVTTKYSMVATGYIKSEPTINEKSLEHPIEKTTEMKFTSEDIYYLLQKNGYLYQDEFRGIKKSNSTFTEAQLTWNNNWVTFIDSMLQLNLLNRKNNSVSQPRHIHKIIIDLQMHNDITTKELDKDKSITANVSTILNYTRCGGVVIDRINFFDLTIHQNYSMMLTSLKFIPSFQRNLTEINTSLQVYLQMVADNLNKETIRVVEIFQNNTNVFENVMNGLNNIPVNYKHELIDINNLKQKQTALEADVLLIDNLSKDESVLQILQNILKINTFVINNEKDVTDDKCLPSKLYRVISRHSAGNDCLELGNWRPVDKSEPSLVLVVKEEADVNKLKDILTKIKPSESLKVISPYGAVSDLKNIIKEFRIKTNRDNIYLVLYIGDKYVVNVDWPSISLDSAFNILENETWGVEYYVPCQGNVPAECGVTLKCGSIGDLSSLYWEEIPELTLSDISVTIRYVGINDNDAKRAAGIIPAKQNNQEIKCYGLDYSGTTVRGERVMGIVKNGAASDRVTAIPELLWPVPAHWTLEDAATVPLAYAQAFYCLGIRSKLYPGMTILVHGAAGALGQAVISIGLAHQCKVFATVSSIRKKKFLLSLYPSLEGCIGNSRDHSFADLVLQATNGKGCDIIFSNLTGDLKNTTLKCAAYCGITFDTVQAHQDDHYTYGMFYLSNQTSYIITDFDDIFNLKEDMDALQTMISEGISRGYVRPLSRVTYATQHATRAFHLVSASRHCGRVLLRLRDYIITAKPRLMCSSDHCQLIICDTKGFGLRLADRLVTRGAKKLHLVCPLLPACAQIQIKQWQTIGIDITVSSDDIAVQKNIEILKKVISLRHIEGIYIIHSNGHNKNFDSIIANLDSLSREFCTSLKYFAVITNDECLGNLVCNNRVNDRLPVTTFQLPSKEFSTQSITSSSTLDALERALRSEERVLRVYPQKSQQSSLLQQIANITGVNIETLKKTGFDSTKLQTISSFLQNTHNIYLTEKQMAELTIETIQDLEDELRESNYTEHSGVAAYISHFDSQEIEASDKFTILPTLDKDVTFDNIHLGKQYLYILPGLEGGSSRFKVMCERLKLPALVLQPGNNHPKNTIEELAQQYAEVQTKKTCLKDNFCILGYESGILAAIQLTAILETKGFTGTVFCIGGTPEEFKSSFIDNMRDLQTESVLQNAVLQHIITLVSGEKVIEEQCDLDKNLSWEEKCAICVKYLMKKTNNTMHYIQSYIEAIYGRFKAVLQYNSKSPCLKSRIVFIRTSSTTKCTSDGDDLQRYSRQPVTVYTVSSPLEHAASDPLCTAIINKHLSTEILEEYEKSNICEKYTVDAKNKKKI